MNVILGAVMAAIILAMASTTEALTIYSAQLSGANEVPPIASPATGLASASLSDDLSTFAVHVVFSGLTGTDTSAFIHLAPAGVNGAVALNLTGFPLGVTSGTYDHTFAPLSASLLGAVTLSQFVTALNTESAYINIHTTTFPGGELRGQLAAVPEPMTFTVLGVGVGALAAWAPRRRAR